MNLIISDKIDF